VAQIVAAEMPVQLAQHHVVLEGGQRGAVHADQWRTGPDQVAEVPGIANVVAGSDGRRIHRGDGGIKRMAVGEIDAFGFQPRHVGHVVRRDAAIAQPVRHEDHDVAMGRLLGRGRCGQNTGGKDGKEKALHG